VFAQRCECFKRENGCGKDGHRSHSLERPETKKKFLPRGAQNSRKQPIRLKAKDWVSATFSLQYY
jgi:hypothetical protein